MIDYESTYQHMLHMFIYYRDKSYKSCLLTYPTFPGQSESMMNNHAIVFGASGIIGWSVVDQLLSAYPERGLFSRVTAVTNRPLELEESKWPQANKASEYPELQLISGIDLRLNGVNELAEKFKAQVQGVHEISHIFYFGKWCIRISDFDDRQITFVRYQFSPK
jgi:hypothetical protein